MPDHRLHPVADEAGGDVHRLARVAAVVHELDGKALAPDAAGGVDVVHRHLGAAPELFAQWRIGAGEGGRRADQDVGRGIACGGSQRQQGKGCEAGVHADGHAVGIAPNGADGASGTQSGPRHKKARAMVSRGLR